jgi:hypothetical protein
MASRGQPQGLVAAARPAQSLPPAVLQVGLGFEQGAEAQQGDPHKPQGGGIDDAAGQLGGPGDGAGVEGQRGCKHEQGKHHHKSEAGGPGQQRDPGVQQLDLLGWCGHGVVMGLLAGEAEHKKALPGQGWRTLWG